MDDEKVFWLVDSEPDGQYSEMTWIRLIQGQEFVERVEKEHKIVGIIFKENLIGFILGEKK